MKWAKQIFAAALFCVISGPADALTFEQARHLLARTGFGLASPAEIEAILPLGYEQAVDRILDGVKTEATTPVPEFMATPSSRPRGKEKTAENRKAFRRLVNSDKKALKSWWVREMVTTASPFTEHMVLFWHNHFVSEMRKVKLGNMMYQQNAIFRKQALGNFATMVRDVSKGPAMLVYLDGNKNKRGKPNENFAREFLELFTMGEGQGYTEQDIKEAARAFTGWAVNPKTGKFVFNKKQHDTDRKTIFGRSGNFDGDDVIDLVLSRDRPAVFIIEKLWQEFVSQKLDSVEIHKIADQFRGSKYNIRDAMKGILMSKGFRQPSVVGQLIKSPVELIIGSFRLTEIEALPASRVQNQLRQLGQDILDPPDVKGWRGHQNWITSETILKREQFANFFMRGVRLPGDLAMADDSMGQEKYSATWPDKLIVEKGADVASVSRHLLSHQPSLQRSTNGKNLNLIKNLILDPVYQLK